MTKGKGDANQHKPTYLSTDPSFGGGNNDCSKMTKFSAMDSMPSDFPLSAPPNEMEIDDGNDNDDHEMAPWPSSVECNATNIQKECTSKALFSATELGKSDRVASETTAKPSVVNFPYFSRFASLSRKNTRNTVKATVAECQSNNQEEATLVKCCHQESDSHVIKQLSEPPSVKGIDSPNPEQVPLVPQQYDHHEKIPEHAMATSSVCSANILERVSNDLMKRKGYETEDSAGLSDEPEDESIGARKTVSYHTGSKRTRAMHNLTKRKRRDRINEQMRELQEIIPNCDKTDRASLLDEAIDYMRTLQHQLQCFQMGAGMCMSPMMLPAMMQQARRPYVPQLAPMGIRAGFGMGIHDPSYNMTPMHNVEISVPGHPMSNPMFPGQEILMSMPCVPLSIFGNSPLRVPVGNVTAMPNDNEDKSFS